MDTPLSHDTRRHLRVWAVIPAPGEVAKALQMSCQDGAGVALPFHVPRLRTFGCLLQNLSGALGGGARRGNAPHDLKSGVLSAEQISNRALKRGTPRSITDIYLAKLKMKT